MEDTTRIARIHSSLLSPFPIIPFLTTNAVHIIIHHSEIENQESQVLTVKILMVQASDPG